MRQLIWKLIPPYEVRLTIEEAKRLLETANFCRGTIEPKVLALVKDAEKTVYSIRIDRMKPDQLALLLITNVIGQEVGSGTHHIYRGVLSMIGKDMQNLWNITQRAMLERGYCDQAEADKDNAWLREQIRNAG